MKSNKLSNNPTLLSLLKAGATITFPDGYIFKGNTKLKQIELKTPLGLPDGQVVMNRKNLEESMSWKRKYFKHV